MTGIEQHNSSSASPSPSSSSGECSDSSSSSAESRRYNLRLCSQVNRVLVERRKEEPRKRKPKLKPPPLSKYRRKTANSRERTRMNEVNQAFEDLRNVIPEYPPGKMTKITTLRLALNYLAELRELLGYSDDAQTEQHNSSVEAQSDTSSPLAASSPASSTSSSTTIPQMPPTPTSSPSESSPTSPPTPSTSLSSAFALATMSSRSSTSPRLSSSSSSDCCTSGSSDCGGGVTSPEPCSMDPHSPFSQLADTDSHTSLDQLLELTLDSCSLPPMDSSALDSMQEDDSSLDLIKPIALDETIHNGVLMGCSSMPS